MAKGSMNRAEAVKLWTRSMATMLAAGINLERALSFSGDQARNLDVTNAVNHIRADVHRGVSLAAAMRKHGRLFGTVHIALVAAGEETGSLAPVMERLAAHLEEEAELRGKLRSALMYPAIMAFVTTLGLIVMVLFVIPRLAEMLNEAGGTLPLSTRLLIGVSTFFATWWPLLTAMVAVVISGVRHWTAAPANRVRWHAVRLKIPLVGQIEREFGAARFTRTLALLLSNGTPIISALRIARSSVSNESLAAAIERATTGVSEGRKMSAELAGVLPPAALQLLSVGEETGKLGELSLRAAESYETDLARRLRVSIGFIEPALIVIFGGIVGFVAIAMLQAIYSINGRLG
ncbi:MAG: type II secretion system F family protein [Gemmatimonadaceae bacterium]|nr:type II secretion system F family protein [Gemmatimonadaceae bacterium]